MTDRKSAPFAQTTGAILTAIVCLAQFSQAAQAHRAYSSYGDLDESEVNRILSGKKPKASKAHHSTKPAHYAKTVNLSVTHPAPNKTAAPVNTSTTGTTGTTSNSSNSSNKRSSAANLMVGSTARAANSGKSKKAPLSQQEKLLSARPAISPPTSLDLGNTR